MPLSHPQRWSLAKALAGRIPAGSLETSEQLHIFANGWNLDYGKEPVAQVLDHPKCSLATAALLYFRMSAGYYRQYESRTAVPDFELANYDVVMYLRGRIEARNFAGAAIAFDPAPYLGDYGEEAREWDHPLVVTQRMGGREVNFEVNAHDFSNIIETVSELLAPLARECSAEVRTEDRDDNEVSVLAHGAAWILDVLDFEWTTSGVHTSFDCQFRLSLPKGPQWFEPALSFRAYGQDDSLTCAIWAAVEPAVETWKGPLRRLLDRSAYRPMPEVAEAAYIVVPEAPDDRKAELLTAWRAMGRPVPYAERAGEERPALFVVHQKPGGATRERTERSE